MTSDTNIGLVIDGRLRLDVLLGAGGMGKVYRARQLSVERDVAVKLLRPDLSELETIQQRFYREAKVLASVQHPNVIGLLDFGRDEATGSLYISMEYIEGHTLTQLLASGKPPVSVIVEIFRQVCAGLAQAHEAGIVHRDLKPDNIMLRHTADGALAVTILDFGIALPKGEAETRFTQTGAVLGTPQYMSPEQVQDRPVDHRSDLYAVGAMAYRALTGSVPFHADTPLAQMFKTVHEQHQPITEVLSDPTVPTQLSALVDRLLSKNPDERPASASEAAREFEQVAGMVGSPSAVTIDEMTSVLAPPVAAFGLHEGSTAEAAPTVEPGMSVKPWHFVAGCGGLVVACLAVIAAAGAMFVIAGSDEPVKSEAEAPAPAKVATEQLYAEPVEPPTAADSPEVERKAEEPEPESKKPKKTKKPKKSKGKGHDKIFKKLEESAKEHAACQRGECRISLVRAGASYVCQTERAECVVDCPAGGCRTSCQGADCTFGCSGGGCTQVCFSGECKFSCTGGLCDRTNLGEGRYRNID